MSTSRGHLALIAVSGFAGSAGVALAAIAAHRVQSPALASAATLLMVHAAAAVAIAAVAAQSAAASSGGTGWLAAGWLLLAGSILFAADITLLSFTGGRLFPMAAPTGGSTMIGGWLVLALVALAKIFRHRHD